jgi:hypothetical protein
MAGAQRGTHALRSGSGARNQSVGLRETRRARASVDDPRETPARRASRFDAAQSPPRSECVPRLTHGAVRTQKARSCVVFAVSPASGRPKPGEVANPAKSIVRPLARAKRSALESRNFSRLAKLSPAKKKRAPEGARSVLQRRVA